MHRNHGRWIGLALAIAASALLLPAAAEAQWKTYSVEVKVRNTGSPADVPYGTQIGAGSGSIDARIRVTNLGEPGQKIGSVNITVPAEFGNPVDDPESTGPKDADPSTSHVRELRGLTIGDKQTLTYDMRFTAPTAQGSYSWLAAAKQSQTFSNDNLWSLAQEGNVLDTEVGSSNDYGVVKECEEDEACSVTLRHHPPCSYIQELGGNCEATLAAASSALDAATISASHFVETHIVAAEVDGFGNDAGTLELWYESGQDLSTMTDEEGAGCRGYDEPSNNAARFEGPANRELVVTYRVSPDLWDAVSDSNLLGARSCFSAPYFYIGQYDVPATFKFPDGGTTWLNAFLLRCPQIGNPCQESTSSSAGGGAVTVDRVPWSLQNLPDPMRY